MAIAPGIHKAEAALRSVAYIAKFQKVSREAEAKATKDILSTIKNIQKTRNKTLGVMEQIEKVQNGSATILEKEVIYRNDQLRYLIDMHGEEKAMNIARKKGVAILDETLKMERKINKEKYGKAFKEAKKAGNVRAGYTGKVIRGLTGGRFGQNMATGLSNEEREMIGQYQSLMADDSSSQRLNDVKYERNRQILDAKKAYSEQVKFLERAIEDKVKSAARAQEYGDDEYLQQFGLVTQEMYQKAFESSEEMQRLGMNYLLILEHK